MTDSGRFSRFANILMEWNRIHNLTGAKHIRDIYTNIEDSIYPTRFIDTPSSILDVGTGAGFPGLILGMIYPDTDVVLCEPRSKRASFLKFVALELEMDNIEVVKKRVEEYKQTPFQLISSRAVTDTKVLLSITSHLRDRNTRYLFYKGERVFNELKDITLSIDYDIIKNGKRNYLYIKGVRDDI